MKTADVITTDTTFDTMRMMPVFRETAHLFQGKIDPEIANKDGRNIRELSQTFPVWNAESMLLGVRTIADLYDDGKSHLYSVYSEKEIAEEPARKDVELVWYPGDPEKPFIIVIAGGAYMNVCSLAEAFPVAAAFHEAGYPAFVLNYRTNVGTVSPLFPEPVDDLAAALTHIICMKDVFGLQNMHYAIAGFSAGGNLANTWGLKTVGYAHYRLPRPDVLFCNYTVTDLMSLDGKYRILLSIMFGKDYTTETVKKYDVLTNMTAEYPPCYITAALNDDQVPVSNSQKLDEKLSELGIPHRAEFGQTGGHGYGDGRGTPLYGWTDRALAFWQSL